MKELFTNYRHVIIGLLLIIGQNVSAQDEGNLDEIDLFDLSLEQLLNINVKDESVQLYGFINSNVERVFNNPSLDGSNNTIRTTDPFEWSPIKNFHLYASGDFNEKLSFLFNLAAEDDLLTVRNAWGNYKVNDYFQIKVGQIYRNFGLYNSRLDQIPTFVGIESPELFDGDHLFLSRVTTAMIHGVASVGKGELQYSFTSENPEAGPQDKVFPFGWDFRYKSDALRLIVGTSGFTSNIGSERSASGGSGGILDWMSSDKYNVFGVFMEKPLGKFFIQTEYWVSNHDAIRDPASTLNLVYNANINDAQRDNFLGANANLLFPSQNDIVQAANYTSKTFYVRLSYNIQSPKGQFVPYFFFDTMSNPEIIQRKSFGGDNEAGLADDGVFTKTSLGIVYRPINSVAIKLDASNHTQNYNGEKISYPEIRADFSFGFDLLKKN